MFGAGAGANGNRVEAILRREGLLRVRTSKAGADDSPIRCAGGKQVVDHDRLVRPVEGADAEVDDARRDPRSVVTGAADMAGKPIEVDVGEAQIGARLRSEGGRFRHST